MKERPIIFSAPMVRAILAGTKTQTRRALAPDLFISSGGAVVRMASAGPATTGIREAHCPYWRQPGDRLWVRETWAPRTLGAWPLMDQHMKPLYRASEDRPEWKRIWKPSIHMPRWASRITLEVTGVRVERLQDISEADAIAEGAPWAACGAPQEGSHKAGFAQLWESINGSNSWSTNPWVWVIEFKRVTP